MPEEGEKKAVAVKRLNEMNQHQMKIFEDGSRKNQNKFIMQLIEKYGLQIFLHSIPFTDM